MDLDLFVAVLVSAATLTALVVEIIKTTLDAASVKYNSTIIAVVLGMIVGIVEIFIYYISNGLDITWITVTYAICMGIANTVCATTGYDLIDRFLTAVSVNIG